MADLQRSMNYIWNIVRACTQGVSQNSDTDAFADSDCSEKFSWPESGENIIRSDLVQIGPDQ
jgi:hypothetical protein